MVLAVLLQDGKVVYNFETALTILISTLTIPSSAHSQDKGDWLVEKLRTADTVILVSHAITAGVKIVDTSTGKISLFLN